MAHGVPKLPLGGAEIKWSDHPAGPNNGIPGQHFYTGGFAPSIDGAHDGPQLVAHGGIGRKWQGAQLRHQLLHGQSGGLRLELAFQLRIGPALNPHRGVPPQIPASSPTGIGVAMKVNRVNNQGLTHESSGPTGACVDSTFQRLVTIRAEKGPISDFWDTKEDTKVSLSLHARLLLGLAWTKPRSCGVCVVEQVQLLCLVAK